MTALWTADAFGGIGPGSVTSGGLTLTTPPNPNDAVELTRRDGSVVTVFDSTTTALACLAYLEASGLRRLRSGDVEVQAVPYAKLLVYELAPPLCLLAALALPTYMGGVLVFEPRSVSPRLSLTAALHTVGYGPLAPVIDNAGLLASGVPMVLVDWNYSATWTPGTGTLAVDDPPVQWSSGLTGGGGPGTGTG